MWKMLLNIEENISRKLSTFEFEQRLLFNAYFQRYSIKLAQILIQEYRHANEHFSCRKHFKIQIGKMYKQTLKTGHVQNFENRARLWPSVEETLITFKPPPRTLRSLYRWNRIKNMMNATWAEKFISSPISIVLKKRLTQNFRNRLSLQGLKNNNKNKNKNIT